MALWGNKDNLNIGAAGTVYVSDWTHDGTDGYQITGSGTTFTNFSAGDVIRFGDFKGTYYGDAVISSITSNTVAHIASTEGLNPCSWYSWTWIWCYYICSILKLPSLYYWR